MSDLLVGAQGRLLPLSIPMRFFGAAAVHHLLAWIAIGWSAETWVHAPAAPGWPLAALHLVTLGVLVMAAIGAGTQLLPVATRQAVPRAATMAMLWWLYTAAVALLVAGMALLRPPWMAAGAGGVVLALVLWGSLVVRQLVGARGMPGIVWHGWGAMAALAVALIAAVMLVASWLGVGPADRVLWQGLHRIAAPFGFMGMLALGLAYILVPMFAVASAPTDREQRVAAALAVAACALGLVPGVGPAAAALGLAAVALHLHLMHRTLGQGLRQRLGLSFLLVRVAWAGLAASLALGLAIAASWLSGPRWAGLFGLAVIGLWLMSFLFGVLQRIVPFLAAMHGGRRAPTPAALSWDAALRVHAACHLAALALLAAALVATQALLARVAALVGAIGALAFLAFFAAVLWRARRHLNWSKASPNAPAYGAANRIERNPR